MGGNRAKGVRRLRLGELVCFGGAICLILSLTLPWYGGANGAAGADAAGRLDAWATFGPTIVLLAIACVVALLLGIVTVFERSTALPVAVAVWATLSGLIAVIAAIVRLLERPGGSSSLQIGVWLALIGAIAVFVGGWLSMRDERTELYEPADAQRREL